MLTNSGINSIKQPNLNTNIPDFKDKKILQN
jgi:hypothetical protein